MNAPFADAMRRAADRVRSGDPRDATRIIQTALAGAAARRGDAPYTGHTLPTLPAPDDARGNSTRASAGPAPRRSLRCCRSPDLPLRAPAWGMLPLVAHRNRGWQAAAADRRSSAAGEHHIGAESKPGRAVRTMCRDAHPGAHFSRDGLRVPLALLVEFCLGLL